MDRPVQNPASGPRSTHPSSRVASLLRGTVVILLATAFAAALAACSDDDPPGSGGDGSTTETSAAPEGDGQDDPAGEEAGGPSALRALEEDLCSIATEDEMAEASGLPIADSSYPAPNQCEWGTGMGDHGVIVRVIPEIDHRTNVENQRFNRALDVDDGEVADLDAVLVTSENYGSVLVGPEGESGPSLEVRAGNLETATAVAERVLPKVLDLLES